MKVSVGRLSELSAADVGRWHSFQRQTDGLGSPFLTPEFAIAMSEGRPDQRVAIIEDGGEVHGYFCFDRRRLGLGRAFCYGLSDVQGVVHAPGYEWNGAALLQACGLDVWSFDHLISDQVERFAAGRQIALRVSPMADLRDGWESWIARKQSSQRMKDIRRHERKLTRELGAPRFEGSSRDAACLDRLMQWKSAQYRRTGRFDRFAQAGLATSIRRLLDTSNDGFSTELSVMFVRDRPASLHLALRFDGMLAGWFPAYDVSLGSYGVGNIHHLQILRQAAQSGVEFFDFGAGDEPYKRTFGDSAHLVAKGSASAPSAVALTHRIQSASTKLVTDFVLNHPPLRRAARQALNLLGSVRILLHSRVRLRGSGSRR